MGKPKNKLEDIWKRIEKKGEDDCWKWVGRVNKKGYGEFDIYNKKMFVHRLVYEYIYGSIPVGLYILHHCDNPSCCNPEHLFLGDQDDNMKDMKMKERQHHPRGEKNGRSKLIEEEVKEIRKKYYSGKYFQYQLAEEYGVVQSVIGDIVTNKHWKHI